MPNQDILSKIEAEIFQLTSPQINESRRQQIRAFVDSAINGDTAQDFLVINSTLSKDRTGALVYVLTNVRLIKIEIDNKNVQSTSPSLNTIINVDWKLLEGDRTKVAIYFQNDFFGLAYSALNQKITDFFKKVDLARAQRKS